MKRLSIVLLILLSGSYRVYTALEPKTAVKQVALHENSISKEEEILTEAASKRFDVRVPDTLKNAPPTQQKEFKKVMAKHMLIETLIGETLEKEPEVYDEIAYEMRALEPRILNLSQQHGEYKFSQNVVIQNTLDCDDISTNASFTVTVSELPNRLCMDMLLEYPGGFVENLPIEVKVLEFDDMFNHEGAEEQWSNMVKMELRKRLKSKFVEHYQKTGSLTYDL